MQEERLTEWAEDGAIPRMDLKNNGHSRCMQKLAMLEDMQAQKRLIELPYSIDGIVYSKHRQTGFYLRGEDAPYTYRVCFIGVSHEEDCVVGYVNMIHEKGFMIQLGLNEFGKTVFLTREEAEAALTEEAQR